MHVSFAHLLFLMSKGTYVRALAEELSEASICIVRKHELTTPNGRGKKSREPKPRRLFIEPILQMLHSATSSRLVI
jgi:tRNA U55 pseudouridine synthase TruB